MKTVSLGAATEQWHKLQEDLSLESGAQLAGILLHCYNAWSRYLAHVFVLGIFLIFFKTLFKGNNFAVWRVKEG